MNAVLKLFLSLGTMKNILVLDNRFELSLNVIQDKIEPMSIDEAYLDVTENKLGIKSAVKIARLIQAGYLERTPSNCFCRCILQ